MISPGAVTTGVAGKLSLNCGIDVVAASGQTRPPMDFLSQHTIIGTLVIGLIVGAIAKLLIPGKDPGGCIITILLGIAGAFVGTWVGRLSSVGDNYLAGWLMS